jgi:putative endonuclease
VKSISLPEVSPPAVHPDKVFVYIIQSPDGAFYVGNARDVARRLKQHRSGRGAKFTHDHGAAMLVHVEGPMELSAGVQREFQLKRWSRGKKEALILGDQHRLKELSRSRD